MQLSNEKKKRKKQNINNVRYVYAMHCISWTAQGRVEPIDLASLLARHLGRHKQTNAG